MAGKPDDAALPPPTLRTILRSLEWIITAAILAMRAVAEEENARPSSQSQIGKRAQIDAAFAKVKVSAHALNASVGAVSRDIDRLVSDLQRLKRLYGQKRRRTR